jgi:hypothetical protein
MVLAFDEVIEYEEFELGHLLKAVFNAFASKPRILDSTIGHVVNSERGNIVDDNASNV